MSPAAREPVGEDPETGAAGLGIADDPRLRRELGIYPTPGELVGAQCRLVARLLGERLGRPLAFADDGVVTVDPGTGTGAYLLAALEEGLRRVRELLGPAAVPGRATATARRLVGYEVLPGACAAARRRLADAVRRAGGEVVADGLGLHVADALRAPDPSREETRGEEIASSPLPGRPREASRSAAWANVVVCLGNPPYNRRRLGPGSDGGGRKGGWVRFGHDGARPLLEDFLAPAREAGAGVHLKNLYNDYVYFWRWALRRVLEARRGPGIVSLVTASSYLRGPAFAGMRQALRAAFDELWLLDLGGDGRGGRRSENVFPVRTPVAVAFGVRRGEPRPEAPAPARYARLDGSREEKLAALGRIGRFENLDWRDCPADWTAPFLPAPPAGRAAAPAPGARRAERSWTAHSRNGRRPEYQLWPRLTELFPWQSSGVQLKRTWPVGETPEVLERRWRALVGAPRAERAALFHESRDRSIDSDCAALAEPSPSPSWRTRPNWPGERLPPLAALDAGAPAPPIVPYAYRSFDRRWLLLDPRLGDYLRPRLWRAHSPRQLYLTSLLTKPLGSGPAATVAAHVPDLDHFSNRGGRDVIPLWRDAAATEPNVVPGLLDRLSGAYGFPVVPEDLFAYAYALLASPAYSERFAGELADSADGGPRLPLTGDARLFRRAAELGRRLVHLHTRGERFAAPADAAGADLLGAASATVPVGEELVSSRGGGGRQNSALRATVAAGGGKLRPYNTPGEQAVATLGIQADGPPGSFSYDEKRRALRVGAGEIAPVAPEVWRFSVSGFRVVRAWLAHRMRRPAGRRSSPLDAIRPACWSEETTTELLGLLELLAATVALFPALERMLDDVADGPSLAPSEGRAVAPSPLREEGRGSG